MSVSAPPVGSHAADVQMLSPARQTLDGTIRVFLAEALILPTGLLSAAFLTRSLGPRDYGLFTLAATIVVWTEWVATSAFSRATVKFVSEAEDWHPIAGGMMRLHLLVGLGGMGLLWLLAGPIAAALQEPGLATPLRLFAVDVPIVALAQAHRHVLIGLGRFGQRAWSSAGRWTARLALIVVFVQLGLSLEGAVLGCIGGSVAELTVNRYFARPPWRRAAWPSLQAVKAYLAPLLLVALSLRAFDKLDLVTLKALGGSTEQVGWFGAADNLTVVSGIFAMSFSPLLLSTLTRLARQQAQKAREVARDALRLVVLLVPFAGMTAGASVEVVQGIFGPAFAASAPVLAWLIFASLALAMVSVCTAILTAAGKPLWALALVAPLAPVSLAGYVLAIPPWGPGGAAAVTAGVSVLCAGSMVVVVDRFWGVRPSAATVARSSVVCAAAYALALAWPAPGLLLLVKIPAISVAIALGFALLGELRPGELAQARSMVRALRALAGRPRAAGRSEAC